MTTGTTVRRCREDDWRDVRRLHVQLALGVPLAVDVELNDVFATPDHHWRDFTAACSNATDQAFFVAVEGDACVGMGHVRLDDHVARLGMLFVNERFRRRGLGTAILEAQEQWAREGGARQLVCHIPDSSPAGRLTLRSGWRRSDEVFTAKNRLVERRWTKALG
jgi:GNAT superfamily N-acetyltransferase